MRSPHLVRPRLALLLAAGLTTLVTPAGVAHAATATVPARDTPITITSTEQLAPGVTYGSFEVTTPWASPSVTCSRPTSRRTRSPWTCCTPTRWRSALSSRR